MRRFRTALAFTIAATITCSGASITRADDAGTVKTQIQTIIDKEYPSLETLYTQIHSHPELSLKEEQTAALLAKELRATGFEVTEHFGGTGIVAVLKNGEGKTLLLRTELDALPIREQTNAPFASTVIGVDHAGKAVPVMHACGHDIHMTAMVGTARTMAAMKDRWKGTLIIIGQPAEELLEGAKAMLKEGLLEKFPRPDFCVAQHCDSTLEAGKVGVTPGFAMANVDSLDILIRGFGGHGAAPETTKDPIVIAAETIMALQTITSREVKPGDPVVITVGSIHGGTKHNIIPDEVKLEVTVRTYKDETRAQVLKAIDRIVKGTAATAGVPEDRAPTITPTPETTSSTYNSPELTERSAAAMRAMMGDDHVIKRDPSMGSEDFGLFGRTENKIPIFFIRLGTVAPEKVAAAKAGKLRLPSLHSSTFLPEREPAIKTGIVALSATALDLLGK